MCYLDFNPSFDNSYSGMASSAASMGGGLVKAGLGKLWGGKKKEKTAEEEAKVQVGGRGDDYNITIKKISDTETDNKGRPLEEVLSEGSGTWLSYMQISNSVMWRIDQDVPLWN